ncbi:MAG: hypothetical protein ACE5KT_02800, partial [Methanosarcinales archaeon]
MILKSNKIQKSEILNYGSILVRSEPVDQAEEMLYKIVHDACDHPEINGILWICYQSPPSDVKRKQKQYNLEISKVSDNIWFIDMISNMMGLKQEGTNVNYCSSPTDYNCLFKYVDNFIAKFSKCLIIFDNLNAVMSYDVVERLIKMLRNMNNKVIQKNSAIIYLSISGAFNSHTDVAIQTTMNKVIDLDSTISKSYMDMTWKDLKNISWREVFSLNVPLLFVLLIVMW